MIKYIILVCLVYLAYRLFIGPPLLSEMKRRNIKEGDEEEDFVDYEEID